MTTSAHDPHRAGHPPLICWRRWRRASCSCSGSAAGPTSTQFAGAVVAPGTLVVELDVKKVQHPTGGIVGHLMVREGPRVKAGDLLVRLDETTTMANLLIITDSLDEQTARQGAGSRLNATTS